MRILVTHQRQVLPRCDRVMVLRGGRVVALGTFAEVSALGLPELTAGMGHREGCGEEGQGEGQGEGQRHEERGAVAGMRVAGLG